jgi:exopolysaccharide biosynthesis protein
MSIGPNGVEDAALLLKRLKESDASKRWAKLLSKFNGRPQFRLTPADDITNGVPQLIKNGKIDITWEQEKAGRSFVEMRHPRTAVAKLRDGKFLMITVDGRQPGVSVGMTLQELADYLLSLGAIDAMNLDGGGSTTMFLDGRVVNTPSDREGERKVGDAILVTLRKNARR